MRIGIIGGGSIGMLISGYLQRKHHITIYVRRSEQKDKIQRHGLVVDKALPLFGLRVALLDEIEKEDVLIICVKQYHLRHILSDVLKKNSQTSLLFLQNGMGHIQLLKSLKQPVYIGVVEHGAYRVDDHIVNHTGKGKIKIASYNVRDHECENLAKELHQFDFPFEAAENWYNMLVEKLTVNAVINPLTALFNIRNGDIIHNPYIKKIAYELCKETTEILNLDTEEQWAKVESIALNTNKNTSSMLSDINRNQPTEIDSISGYLASINGHHAPLTSFVYNSIKALEKKKGINT